MATSRIEISTLPIKSHHDWATHADYDKTQAVESAHVQKHAELAGTSSIYASELNDFTGLAETPSTWAHFPLPPGYTEKTNYFFSNRLFPTDKSPDEEVKILLDTAKSLSETERAAIESFARVYDLKNQHLAEANARRLHLQKS